MVCSFGGIFFWKAFYLYIDLCVRSTETFWYRKRVMDMEFSMFVATRILIVMVVHVGRIIICFASCNFHIRLLIINSSMFPVRRKAININMENYQYT